MAQCWNTLHRVYLALIEYTLSGQTAVFGIGATVATNGYDARVGEVPPPSTPVSPPPAAAANGSTGTGLYIGAGAVSNPDGTGGS